MEVSVRLLRADEIECRVSVINEKGLSLLLFKDARVDQKILDETFTPFGWKRSHQAIDGNLYCTVEIWDSEKKEWIGKQDVGTMSYSEKEKGQASAASSGPALTGGWEGSCTRLHLSGSRREWQISKRKDGRGTRGIIPVSDSLSSPYPTMKNRSLIRLWS